MWLMRKLANAIARGQPEAFHHLVSILHATALLKAVLPFDFVQHIWPEAMHFARSFYTALLSVGYSP